MASPSSLEGFVERMTRKFEHEAFDLERASKHALTDTERRLKEMHARTLRGCAQVLRIEASKVTNRG